MSLKELTKDNHKNAERSWFARLMFSGQISNEQYAMYLKQQYECYKALEDRFDSLDQNSSYPFPDSRIKRAKNIYTDLLELCDKPESLSVFESTKMYVNYILNKCPESLLYAHVYVRYLGDLKGGQMIASRVPGAGEYYKFESPEELESSIRKSLRSDEDFVNESKKCFNSAILLFEDLKSYFEAEIISNK